MRKTQTKVRDEDLPKIRQFVSLGWGEKRISRQLGASVRSVHSLMRQHNLLGISITEINRNKTHCKHGHPFSGDNLKTLPNGERRCVECLRRRGRVYDQNVRANKRSKE